MESVYREILGFILIIFFVLFIIWIKLKLWEEESKAVYTCKKCGTEGKLSDMKHYDYEYNYEYRCAKCNTIVVEG